MGKVEIVIEEIDDGKVLWVLLGKWFEKIVNFFLVEFGRSDFVV